MTLPDTDQSVRLYLPVEEGQLVRRGALQAEAALDRGAAHHRAGTAVEGCVPGVARQPTRLPAGATTAGTGVRLELPPELRVAAAPHTPQPKAPPNRWLRLRPTVLLRILVAAGAIALAAWYLTERLLLTSSLDAVVSAPLVPMRAPINGRVRIGEAVAPGGVVHAGQTLFTLADDQVDERALVDVQARLATTSGAAQTIANRVTVLEGMQSTLRQRASLYRDATVQRLAAMLAEAQAAHGSAQVQLSLSQVELARTRDLSAHGVQSSARLDEAETVARRAALEVEHLAASMGRSQVELDSARRGVVIGDGFADAPYSLQRQDEIAMRLSELVAERDALGRTRRELTKRLAAEEKHLTLLRKGAVTSSAAGLVWSLGVADGTRVSRGDVLGEFADCSRTYVEATLPERGFEVVRLGATVRVRLSSGTAELPGTVRSLHGAGAAGTTTRAASIEQVRSGLMTVVVDVDPAALAGHSAGGCQLGRSAKVLF